MPEIAGVVIVPKLDVFDGYDAAKIVEDERLFVEMIFEIGGFNKKALDNGPYTIEEASIQGEYIELGVFGGEWYMLGKSAVQNKDRHLELYAKFHDEYGTIIYLARNSAGESFGYSYEDDGGDESEQDYFDIDEYISDLESKEKKYLSIIPNAVISTISSIYPEKPMFLSDYEG